VLPYQPDRCRGSRIRRGGTIVVAAHHVDSKTYRERDADGNDQAPVVLRVHRQPRGCNSSRYNGAHDTYVPGPRKGAHIRGFNRLAAYTDWQTRRRRLIG